MNKAIYDASERISKPNHIVTNKEYIFYVPWAKKIDMKIPLRIKFTSIEVENGIVISGMYEPAINKSKNLNRSMIAKNTLKHCVFNIEDELKCKALYCKAYLFYKPHQIKGKIQDYIDNFNDEYPELMI